MNAVSGIASFSEKAFYLREFRGRTLAFAVPRAVPVAASALAGVLAELARNASRAVVVAEDAAGLEKLTGSAPLPADAPRLEGQVWRVLRRHALSGVHADPAAGLAPVARDVALRLGVAKLVWLDPAGGLVRGDGTRASFVDRSELAAWPRTGPAASRAPLLSDVAAWLDAGVPAVNVCTLEGLADELFTYAGSGTLFTRERYVTVRRLRLDDFDAAADLLARGVAEGFLAPRSDEEVDRVLARGFGAFVEGVHLAGIGALLPHAADGSGELASLYTLTRFLREGIGGHLVQFAVEAARREGLERVFACTTQARVVAFFERQGFRRVPA